MKKFLPCCLSLILIITCATVSYGAIHSHEGEISVTDTWYSVTPQAAYYQAEYLGTTKAIDGAPSSLRGEFYQNEQTFFSFSINKNLNTSYTNEDNEKNTWTDNDYLLKGSYLWKNGVFLGLENTFNDNDPNYRLLSPGYRYNLDDRSYIALSVDYLSSHSINEIYGYELDWKYYNENMKLIGEIHAPQDEDSIYIGSMAFQASPHIVIGGNFDYTKNREAYDAGFTWNIASWIIDAQYGKFRDDAQYSKISDDYYNINGFYKQNNQFGYGLTYLKVSEINTPRYTASLKYVSAFGKFKLAYTPGNGGWDEKYSLSYFATFK